MMAMTGKVESLKQGWLDQPNGRSQGDLLITEPFKCRIAPHPFIQFIHQVQLAASGAELSVASLLSEETTGFGLLLR
ncbi:hypothetical protein M3194_14540 [Paenibacillus glycanilyticus]|uniref:hypothetical protein n=1 Tax=Paenibacillus glycanilyticus TaxID=126569 RepID=UPI00203F52AF|nr:hypothetical protein [Paenibacillus glycanilyticus]MCM3628578.1 hypothetical protein [Paenibacillus glycanilyticus]